MTHLEEHGLTLALFEEETRLNLVKAIIDSACTMIVCGCLSPGQRKTLPGKVKSSVINLIPGQEEKYDMIYASRIKRLLEQFSDS